jgi:hypothetical protein
MSSVTMPRMRLLAILAVLCGMLGPARAVQAQGTEAPGSHVLPFLHDDFPKAVAEARARGVPIFIDVGAPW